MKEQDDYDYHALAEHIAGKTVLSVGFEQNAFCSGPVIHFTDGSTLKMKSRSLTTWAFYPSTKTTAKASNGTDSLNLTVSRERK